MNKQLLLLGLFVLCLAANGTSQTFEKTYLNGNSITGSHAEQMPNGYRLRGIAGELSATTYFLDLQTDLSANQTNANVLTVPNPQGTIVALASDGNILETGISNNKATLKKRTVSGTVMWSQEYVIPNSATVQRPKVFINAAGDIYLVGIEAEVNGAPIGRLYVIKTNPSGTAAWTKKVTVGNTSNAINLITQFERPTEDGGILVPVTATFSETRFLVRLDALGNVAMNVTVAQGLILNSASAEGLGGKSALAFSSTGPSGPVDVSGRLRSYDAAGALQWELFANNFLFDQPLPIVKVVNIGAVASTSDGGYILTGLRSAISVPQSFFMLKVNASGAVVWAKYDYGFVASPAFIRQTSDGGYLVAGLKSSQTWMMKTDANGGINTNPPATCANNLILNPGFEQGLTNWNTIGTTSITTDAHSGTKAAKLDGTGYSSLGFILPTTPGKNYSLSAWAKTGGPFAYQSVAIRFLDASYTTITVLGTGNYTIGTDYTEITDLKTAPLGAAYVYAIAFKDGAGSLTVDDWCLTEQGATFLPDLTASNIQVPLFLNNGVPFNFSCLVKNNGLAGAQATQLLVQLSSGVTIASLPVPALSVGQELLISEQLLLPAGTGTGSVVITADVDLPGNIVLESNELNNGAVSQPVTLNGNTACSLSAQLIDVTCQNNITLVDASDDQFYFFMNVTGTNVGALWTSNNLYNGSYTAGYNQQLLQGPFPISGGTKTFTIQDGANPSCQTSLTVTPPPTCSPQLATNCGFTPQLLGVTCEDAGTPNDPSDDLFHIQYSVSGNTGEPWYLLDGNQWGTDNTPQTIGPFAISDGIVGLHFYDFDDPACEAGFAVVAPASCSNGGGNGQIDLSLTLQQTPAAPAQWGNYTVKATVSNAGPQAATGVKVKLAKPNGVVYTGGNEFVASQGTFAPFGNEEWNVGSIPAGGSATLTVSYFLLQTQAPVAYAQVIAATETDGDSQPNNGTPPVPNQDDEASTTSTPPNLTPDLTVSDLQIPNAIVQQGQVLNYNFDARNIGTGAVPGNFTIKSYISTDEVISATDIQDGTITTGNYGAGLVVNNIPGASTIPANLAPNQYFLIVKIDADGAVAESNEGNNQVSNIFTVTGGSNCSINQPIVATTCDDNGTPGNPADDFFRLYMTVTGTNTGPAWKFDHTGFAAAYGITPLVGAFPISGGPIVSSLTDLMNPACTRPVTITPPAPCSNGGGNECGFLKSYGAYPSVPTSFWTTTAEETASGFQVKLVAKPTGQIRTVQLETNSAGNQPSLTDNTLPDLDDKVTVENINLPNKSFNLVKKTASGTVIWTQTIVLNTSFSTLQLGAAVFPTGNGYLLGGSFVGGPGPNVSFIPYLIKTDLDGNVLKQNFLPNDVNISFWLAIYPAAGGNFYFRLSNSINEKLLKTANDGTVQWISNLIGDLPSTFVAAIRESADGSSVFAAVNDNYNAVAKKFNAASGTLTWSKLLGSVFSPGGATTFEFITGLVPTADGGIVAGYTTQPAPGAATNGYEYGRLDAAGNLVWWHGLSQQHALEAKIATGDGGYLFTGQKSGELALMKITSEGELTPTCGGDSPLADLSFASGQISPSSLAVGSTFDLNYEVANTGGTGADGFEVNYVLSLNAVYDLNDSSLGAIGQQSVPAGSTLPVFQQVAIPPGTAPGNYYLILVADPDNVVAESNENNNTLPIPITITTGGGGTPDCNAISITPGTGQISITGAVAPHKIIKVFRPNWTLAFECLDGTCSNPQVVSGLNAGNHFVEIKLFNAAWELICTKTQTVNVIGGSSNLLIPDDRFRLTFDKFYPNPASHWLNVVLFAPKAQAATLDFYNQQGRRVYSMEMQLEEGRNTLELPVSDWKSGTYNVIARGEGLPAYGRFLKVWEE